MIVFVWSSGLCMIVELATSTCVVIWTQCDCGCVVIWTLYDCVCYVITLYDCVCGHMDSV